MDKFINYREMMEYLFDDKKEAEKAAKIAAGMIKAQSPRITDIAERMDGENESNRKMIHRYLKGTNVKEALMRLYQEDSEFVIGDPTERYYSRKRLFVGMWSRQLSFKALQMKCMKPVAKTSKLGSRLRMVSSSWEAVTSLLLCLHTTFT